MLYSDAVASRGRHLGAVLKTWAMTTVSTVAMLTASFAATQSAQAQQTAQSVANEEIEEVVITGSRIQRSSFDNLQPGVDVTSEYIDDRGYNNVADVLTEIPAFGLATSNSGRQQSQTLGQNFSNAFGLGTQRTLTLINGRRVVAQNTPGLGGGSPGLQVDLNMIPTVMIERVETIFVGGAPIYGSDAIAGTVNLIYKKDYEGFSFDAQASQDERGTADSQRLRALWGANSADGKGNLMIGMEYSTIGGTKVTDNDLAMKGTAHCENPAGGLSASGLPLLVPNDGIPDTKICDDAFGVWQVPTSGLPLDPNGSQFLSANGNGALRDAQGNPLMFSADGRLITWEEANMGSPRGAFFTVGSDAFNNPLFVALGETNNLIAPLDRWIVNATGHREIASNVNVFVEGLYARSESENLSPQATFGTVVFGPGAGGTPRINIAENPFVTEELRDVLVMNGGYDPTSEEDQYVAITRSNIDIGAKSFSFRSQDVFRFVVGLDGTLPVMAKEWTWDTSFNYGETNSISTTTAINGRRLALATDAIRDPGTGEVICRAQIDPPETGFGPTFLDPPQTDVSECIPFNPIGIQNLTEAQFAYLLQQDYQATAISQTVWELNLAGDLFDLPAGPVAFATGYTHRREEAAYNVDRARTVGLDVLTPVQSVSGAFTTNEVYAETLIPIIEKGSNFEVPFISSLELEGAVRWVDNTAAGQDITWTAGGHLRPDLPFLGDSLTFRGNYTVSLRAPSVQELFLPRSEFSSFAEDPCDDEFSTGGPNSQVRQANCQAQVDALKAQGALDPNFELLGFVSLAANRGFPQFTGGNPNLKSETANAWTVGAVFTPEFIPGLTISVDWMNISIENEIARLSASQIMNACFDSPNFPAVNECGLFTRDYNFQVVAPETGFLNAAQRNFAGLMSNFSYDLSETKIPEILPGNFDIFGSLFHVAKHERNVTGGSVEVLKGEQGFESLRAQLNLRWTLDRIGALWQTRYIGKFLVDAQAPTERFSPGENGAPATYINNATLTYQLTDSLGLRLVIDNVFDKRDGKKRRAQTLGGTSTLPFSPLDIIGRRFSLAISGEF